MAKAGLRNWLRGSKSPFYQLCPATHQSSPYSHLPSFLPPNLPLAPSMGTCPQEQLAEALAELWGDGPLRQAGNKSLEPTVSKTEPLAAPLRYTLILLQSA